MEPRTLFLANRPVVTAQGLPVEDKFLGTTIQTVGVADASTIETAIHAAVEAAPRLAQRRPYERRRVLDHCVGGLQARADELTEVLIAEGGKPRRDARTEVARAIDTFRVAAEESVRFGRDALELETGPRSHGYSGQLRRFPIGPCSFITPFNFPLNLVAHKVAPALAVGCPFVLKPASPTPLSALILGEVLAETDLPPGTFSILPCPREAAAPFTDDPRLRLLSFTGSPEVGWALKRRAADRRVVLELGGNAAALIDHDWDLQDAVDRLMIGTFAQSGQSCIGVQRILVHEKIYASLRDEMVSRTRALTAGDPRREQTVVGPMISMAEADRLYGWIQSAIEAGATVLCGGGRDGALLEPTLLEGVDPDQPVCAAEAFGPVAVLAPFDDFDRALDTINESRFGLQAGVFTRDLYRANRAFERLEVGAVVVGDVPSWRVEHMPYGGVKESGIGREGVRYAMEDMTEPRLMVVRDPTV